MPKYFSLRNALIILTIASFQPSFSQENYKPGYVIKTGGDTLRGFIDYRGWEENPDRISFKENGPHDKQTYVPIEIESFGVLDEIYRSAIIKAEDNLNGSVELSYITEIKYKTDTTFLQTMISGPKGLYSYIDKFGKEQFYINEDSSFQLLIYKKSLRVQNGAEVISENKKYIGQLTYYLRDCPGITSKFAALKYNKKSLEALFLLYYKNCSKSEIKFQKKTEKIGAEFGVMAGLSSTSISFGGAGPLAKYVSVSNYPSSTNFSAAFFFEAILPRNQRKWSINNELIFSTYSVKGSYVDRNYNAGEYIVSNSTLGYSYLKINNMVRYRYPVGKVLVFANVGISNGVAIHETNYQRLEKHLFSNVTVSEGRAINDTRLYEQGYFWGLGVKIKRYSFEIRNELGNGVSVYNDLTSSTTRYFLFLGYRL